MWPENEKKNPDFTDPNFLLTPTLTGGFCEDHKPGKSISWVLSFSLIIILLIKILGHLKLRNLYFQVPNIKTSFDPNKLAILCPSSSAVAIPL